MDEITEQPVLPLSATTLCVRYNGPDTRILTRGDLMGDRFSHKDEQLVWTPGSEIEFASWLDYAGSKERALAVLSQHSHEFMLVGPGAAEMELDGEDEFSVDLED